MDDGRMVMSKITGVVNFHMKLTQGLEVTETSYETQGKYYKKNNIGFLFFEEKNIDDDHITKCRLEFDDNTIRIRRNGTIILDQRYTTKKNVDGYIKTPYGELISTVKTHCYNLEECENKFRINLDYDLTVQKERVGNYKLSIYSKKEDMS